jgi:uncharacterized membrane protein YgdD (TMEM256/DUF423 family)
MKRSLSLLMVLIIVTIAMMSSGCSGDDDTVADPIAAAKTANTDNTTTKITVNGLNEKEILLSQIEESSPDTLDALTSYGIATVHQLNVPSTNTLGWKYTFATATGCELYTENVLETPEYSIGLHGAVTGKIVLLGSLPSYFFTNDQSYFYVTPIGNTLVIIGGENLSQTYSDCQIITNAIYQNMGSPESIIGTDKINAQIYPEASAVSTSSETIEPTLANYEQAVATSDYSSFFS